MATVLPIEGGETLQANAATNWAGANKDLKAAFGFGMRVLTPYGGGRTIDQQKHLIKIGLSTTLRSDHVNYVAVDIDNQRQFRNINSAKFVAILKAWGFRNITIDGFPFPSEPWHFVSDNKKRINVDPNSKYQTYYCTGWTHPTTGKVYSNIILTSPTGKVTKGAKVKGRYYLVGNGFSRTTFVKRIARSWSVRFGYGGARDYGYIQSQVNAVSPR